MKSTGIIRRVDDLGRVVIPKEIRRTMRIKENDPLELFVNDNSLVLKKYKAIEDDTFDRAFRAIEKVAKGAIGVYSSIYSVKIRNDQIVPICVPAEWEFHTKPFESGSITVYPVQVLGQVVGYIAVEDCDPNYVKGVISMLQTEQEEYV